MRPLWFLDMLSFGSTCKRWRQTIFDPVVWGAIFDVSFRGSRAPSDSDAARLPCTPYRVAATLGRCDNVTTARHLPVMDAAIVEAIATAAPQLHSIQATTQLTRELASMRLDRLTLLARLDLTGPRVGMWGADADPNDVAALLLHLPKIADLALDGVVAEFVLPSPWPALQDGLRSLKASSLPLRL